MGDTRSLFLQCLVELLQSAELFDFRADYLTEFILLGVPYDHERIFLLLAIEAIVKRLEDLLVVLGFGQLTSRPNRQQVWVRV